jgi:hypothetical protein
MAAQHVNRRQGFLPGVERDPQAVVLSCEQLYMRYLDARATGTTAELFEHLGRDLRSVKRVRLIKTSWLSDDDLMKQLDAVLASYRADGGRIEH